MSESSSSYSVLLQYKFTLLYCVLLRGGSNGPHKEDWPDKRKRSWGLLRGTAIVETWVYKNAGKLFTWHWFSWQHDRELPTVVRARYIYISRAPRSTSKVNSLPILTFRTLYFCAYCMTSLILKASYECKGQCACKWDRVWGWGNNTSNGFTEFCTLLTLTKQRLLHNTVLYLYAKFSWPHTTQGQI